MVNQNGILQVKKPGDVMNQEVCVLSPETGLISIQAGTDQQL